MNRLTLSLLGIALIQAAGILEFICVETWANGDHSKALLYYIGYLLLAVGIILCVIAAVWRPRKKDK